MSGDWHLLAPGPSASEGLAAVLPSPLGVVSSAFPLAPWAEFLAATDLQFWRTYPEAKEFAGRRFAIHRIPGVETVQIPVVNSGVLALEVAKRLGASRIYLHGFDMHGTHYFGPYKNGLKNTPEDKRRQHLKQFAHWYKANRKAVEVVNLTPRSALTCFPRGAWSLSQPPGELLTLRAEALH